MEAKFSLCVDCGTRESYDCPLYLVENQDGFLVICCIVHAINNSLKIIQRMDGLLDNED